MLNWNVSGKTSANVLLGGITKMAADSGHIWSWILSRMEPVCLLWCADVSRVLCFSCTQAVFGVSLTEWAALWPYVHYVYVHFQFVCHGPWSSSTSPPLHPSLHSPSVLTFCLFINIRLQLIRLIAWSYLNRLSLSLFSEHVWHSASTIPLIFILSSLIFVCFRADCPKLEDSRVRDVSNASTLKLPE